MRQSGTAATMPVSDMADHRARFLFLSAFSLIDVMTSSSSTSTERSCASGEGSGAAGRDLNMMLAILVLASDCTEVKRKWLLPEALALLRKYLR